MAEYDWLGVPHSHQNRQVPPPSTIGGLMQSETPRSRTSTLSQSSSAHRPPMYSVEVADAPEIPGEGKPRRHPLAADGTVTDTFEEGIYTLYDTFKNACTKYGNATHARHGSY